MRLRFLPAYVLALLALAGCASLFDIGELPALGAPNANDAAVDEDANESETGGEPTDGGIAGDARAKDGGKDAKPVVNGACDACAIEVLADNLGQATIVAIDDNNVYFADEGPSDGTVSQCPKDGCTAAPVLLGPGYARSIATDGARVYWNEGTKLSACNVGGCARAPTSLAGVQAGAGPVAFDGTTLYWGAGSSVFACAPTSCGSPTVLATQQVYVDAIAAESGTASWIADADGGAVFSCPAAGCATAPSRIAAADRGGVAVHSGFRYWVDGNAVKACAGACASITTLGSSSRPTGLTSDESFVYWRDTLENKVVRCHHTGCGSGTELIASQQYSHGRANVVVDAEYIYWATSAQVLRRHK